MTATTTATTTAIAAIAVTSAADIAAVVSARSGDEGNIASMMMASIQDRYGNADVVSVAEIDRPQIAPDQVLVEVVAAGLDQGVVHLMTGMPYLIRLLGYGLFKPKNPVLGLDVAGRVVQVGSGVTRFAVGDEVMGISNGSFAQYVAADEAKLVHKPDAIPFDAAAVSTISGITALQALTTQGQVSTGERVLVIGASGGVGSFAVQIATALGAQVTGVASGEKVDFVRSLGASEVIDYRTTDLAEVDQTFDLIIDIGGRNPLAKIRRLLTPTGRLVIVGGEDGGRLTGGMGRQIRAALLSLFVKQKLGFFISSESVEYIEPLSQLVASGDVVPAIGSRFALSDTPAAIASLEAGDVSGKVVIQVGA